MHSLLEDYLTKLSEYLNPLPVPRRNEELREMRQHLNDAVMVSKESGQSEEEAVISAVDQFGSPRELGESMILAWRRGKRLDRRSFWGAFACVLTITFVLSIGWQLGLNSLVNSKQFIPGHFPIWFDVAGVIGSFVTPLIAGGMSGYIFPRRAIPGTALAAIISFLLGMAEFHYIYSLVIHHQVLLDVRWSTLTWFCVVVLSNIAKIFQTMLAAWGGSRWRTHKQSLHNALFS